MRRRERDSYDVTDSPAAAFFKRTFTPGFCLTLLFSAVGLLVGASCAPHPDADDCGPSEEFGGFGGKEYQVPRYPNGLPRVTLWMLLSEIFGRPIRSSIFQTDDFEPDRPGFD